MLRNEKDGPLKEEFFEVLWKIQKAGYDLNYIYYVIHGKRIQGTNPNFSRGDEDRLTKTLIVYCDFIINDIANVGIGDFWWADKYEQYEREEAEVFEALHSLSEDDPIFVKYLNNDRTYIDDLRKR